jgi:hypothetical protein
MTEAQVLAKWDVCNSSTNPSLPPYPGQLLEINLSVDFSSVKGNPNTLNLLSDIRIGYSEVNVAGYGPQIYPCSYAIGFPCICDADAKIDGRSIRYLIKNWKNGRYDMF